MRVGSRFTFGMWNSRSWNSQEKASVHQLVSKISNPGMGITTSNPGMGITTGEYRLSTRQWERAVPNSRVSSAKNAPDALPCSDSEAKNKSTGFLAHV